MTRQLQDPLTGLRYFEAIRYLLRHSALVEDWKPLTSISGCGDAYVRGLLITYADAVVAAADAHDEQHELSRRPVLPTVDLADREVHHSTCTGLTTITLSARRSRYSGSSWMELWMDRESTDEAAVHPLDGRRTAIAVLTGWLHYPGDGSLQPYEQESGQLDPRDSARPVLVEAFEEMEVGTPADVDGLLDAYRPCWRRWQEQQVAAERYAYTADLSDDYSGRTTWTRADASRILWTFREDLNDVLPDNQELSLPVMVRELAGTAGDGLDEARSYMALDWLVRTYTPAWLDLAGLRSEAQTLRGLRPIVDLVTVRAAVPVVCGARNRAELAAEICTGCGECARCAARTAAGYATGATAQNAVGSVVWAITDDPDDARVVIWGATRDTTQAAAQIAALPHAVAFLDTADSPRNAWTRAAAGDTAREALNPTVNTLQDSAVDLYRRMVTAGEHR